MILFAYIAMLVGFVFPVAAAVGLIIAYLDDGASGHKSFLIRTFWFGLLMTVVGAVLTIVIVGWLVLLFWFVWTVMRLITGLGKFNAGQGISEPKSLGFKAS